MGHLSKLGGLRALRFFECSGLSGDLAEGLAGCGPGPPKAAAAGAAAGARAVEVDFHGCAGLTSDSLEALAALGPVLEKLDLYRCVNLQGDLASAAGLVTLVGAFFF